MVVVDDVHAEASYPRRTTAARKVLVIACGALAREILALKLDWVDLTCLPASLHNHPDRIPEAMRAKIRANRAAYDEILCLYGDCGTGGALDRVLAEEGRRSASPARIAMPSTPARRPSRRSPRKSWAPSI